MNRLDVVYTWVDGAFPGYAELLQQYSPTKIDLNPNRYRDNLDLLKYSLRSLERYAPWLGHLHLVTTRPQVPDWLDPDAEGFTLVHHDEFFEPEYLPTFNSLCIVSHLHRIPNVSERFVYFEDDMLMAREVPAEDLIDDRGRARFYERFSLEDNAWRDGSPRLSLWASILARSNRLLNQQLGFRLHGSFHSAPIVIDRKRFAELVECFAEDVHRTRASRFRSRGNIALEHMYPYFAEASGEGVFVPRREVRLTTHYVGLENFWPQVWWGLWRIRSRRPKFYCLNDNFGDEPNARSVALTRAFLEELYPEPSRFERADQAHGARP